MVIQAHKDQQAQQDQRVMQVLMEMMEGLVQQAQLVLAVVGFLATRVVVVCII
jgi:hypothetical protein